MKVDYETKDLLESFQRSLILGLFSDYIVSRSPR